MDQDLRFLQVEPTTRCNYTCGFCAGRHMPQIDLPLPQFKALIDSTTNLQHIELQGEGEPLLHPDFFEMIHYAREKCPAVKISFITNGSLFTSDIITNILAEKIHSILVSIESTDEIEFQRIRGGKLSRVKRGIAELIAKKRQHNSPMKVGFAVTVLKETATQINAIGELYENLRMDGGIIIQPLQSMECYTKFYDEQLMQSIPSPDDKLLVNNLIASDQRTQHALGESRAATSFYMDLFKNTSSEDNRCPWLTNGLFVSADGIASSCAFIKDSKKYGFARLTEKLDDIFKKRAQLSNELSAGKEPPQCRSCSIAKNISRRLLYRP